MFTIYNIYRFSILILKNSDFMNSLYWIAIVLTTAIILTYIFKKIFKTDSFLGVFVLLKTQKLTFIVDWLSKKKFIERLSIIGIAIGFGAFGIDYLNRNKKVSKFKRFNLFVFYTLVICIITYFLFGNIFLNNPILPFWAGIVIILFTGLLGLSGLTLASLAVSGIDIVIKTIVGKTAAPGVGLILPGIKMPKVDFFVPWYGWIILIFAAMIHEFCHGSMLKRLKLKIKSIGVILFGGLIPFGAFVEPDEKEIKKKNKHEVMKMYSAGPTSNAIIAIIFFIIIVGILAISSSLVSSPEYTVHGLKVIDVYETIPVDGTYYPSPVFGVLEKDNLIVSINDKNIHSQTDVISATKKDQENKFVIKNISTQEEKTEYITPNEKGTYGFSAEIYVQMNDTQEYHVLSEIPNQRNKTLVLIVSILTWIALLNFLIASVNFLPTVPFDGGFMSQVIFSRYLKGTEKSKTKKIARFFGYLIVFLILLNIIPYFL
jgi:membrane-associated protease RseP (regulator of RpoE activity)